LRGGTKKGKKGELGVWKKRKQTKTMPANVKGFESVGRTVQPKRA